MEIPIGLSVFFINLLFYLPKVYRKFPTFNCIITTQSYKMKKTGKMRHRHRSNCGPSKTKICDIFKI